MADTWKATLPCTRAEAEAIAEDIGPLALLDPPPTLMTSEPDPAQPDAWRFEAFFEKRPGAEALRLLRGLTPSAGKTKPVVERVPDADWVTLSQAGIEPIRAGRFFVHTSTHADAVPRDVVAFRIEAGRAFGTGQHETTTGCLLMLDRMKRQGSHFVDVLDLGAGTGLLAFAALALWPRARAIASDIDPVAVDVAAENAAANGIRLGHRRGRLDLVAAPGMAHPLLAAAAPFDLIVANILAGPLIALAPSVARALAPGGSLILAGLLAPQASAVTAAYRRHGLRHADRIDRGDWPTLRLRKRPATWRNPVSHG